MNARKAVLADNPELILRVLQLRCKAPSVTFCDGCPVWQQSRPSI
ncbi:transposase [Escherichia coli]|nr:transposase [Escherichia coli]GCK48411.1 transposase [Escherichia coli]GCL21993.1 transposase [Escherichia coli]GCM15951.1 transposase [Escherichia coli]GCN01328.1 transposase [Escherichia coli]